MAEFELSAEFICNQEHESFARLDGEAVSRVGGPTQVVPGVGILQWEGYTGRRRSN